ncbi:sigma-70 family RNA polymerase sigma factor [Kribbella albertanoniae]|uniref:Sigma-70 family RNA polymerase sigma factor n=1 Tax=Kribbella albertanoniae TaxID=1266829 RepID=A0A4R4P2T9_9ACTN|nr:sigma-70 family RNA polymerase sigma factor [Kribbella albertanoniae]TDC14980.1 sigma-70 family RNA polymerase sigma factor [Kribbella albertanoniae]
MRDDPVVVALVTKAVDGDKGAWDELVERYAPLIWGIGRRYRLTPADIDDVGQGVWLRLIEHLPSLREPAALPGWIATTTQRECFRLLRASSRVDPVDPAEQRDAVEPAVAEEEVLRHEQRTIVRSAFGQLSQRCQLLLAMIMKDPPTAYDEISRQLAMPVGSIGPNRARCLERLRRTPALAGLADDHGSTTRR